VLQEHVVGQMLETSTRVDTLTVEIAFPEDGQKPRRNNMAWCMKDGDLTHCGPVFFPLY
jgi:hypothetical protein